MCILNNQLLNWRKPPKFDEESNSAIAFDFIWVEQLLQSKISPKKAISNIIRCGNSSMKLVLTMRVVIGATNDLETFFCKIRCWIISDKPLNQSGRKLSNDAFLAILHKDELL